MDSLTSLDSKPKLSSWIVRLLSWIKAFHDFIKLLPFIITSPYSFWWAWHGGPNHLFWSQVFSQQV
jgi:hypothetical protein